MLLLRPVCDILVPVLLYSSFPRPFVHVSVVFHSIYVLLVEDSHDKSICVLLCVVAIKFVGGVGIYCALVVKLYVSFLVLYPSVAFTYQIILVLNGKGLINDAFFVPFES